jgi:hypothetical protein
MVVPFVEKKRRRYFLSVKVNDGRNLSHRKGDVLGLVMVAWYVQKGQWVSNRRLVMRKRRNDRNVKRQKNEEESFYTCSCSDALVCKTLFCAVQRNIRF